MPPYVVSPAAPHELLPACRLLFSDGRAEYSRDRILTDAHMCGLFVARSGGKLHAAALVQALPGALGVAWAPRGDSAEAIDAVTDAACEWLRGRGVKVCQAFAAAGEAAAMLPLEHAGFRRTTQLVFMRSDSPTGLDPVQPLTFTTDEPPFSAEFATTLLATHEGTLDCPELNATRTPAEVLAGFAPTPGSEWYLASQGGECVGVVALQQATGFDSIDLAYLGVVPGARGRGLGAELLAFAVNEGCAARRFALTVSVDARNAPAVRLYERHGFAEYDRRAVWLLTRGR